MRSAIVRKAVSEPDEELAILDGTRELIADAAAFTRAARTARDPQTASSAEAADAIRILGYPANPADELALQMLGQVLRDVSATLDIWPGRLGASELTAVVREKGYRIVCLADLPPSAPSKTRYMVKKLRASIPELPVVVGRWAPASLVDESAQPLLDAGATHVASTLLETRDHLRGVIDAMNRPAVDNAPADPPATAS